MTFGAFISTRRKEAKLNLRDTAKHLGISNGYLCDIEQGRRPAPEGAFVERISSFLELDKQEHEMLLDLAADSRQTVPADLPDYMGIASVQNPFTDRNMPYEQPFQPDAGDAEAVPIFVILSPIC